MSLGAATADKVSVRTSYGCVGNLDHELAKQMKKYFVEEVREKQKQNELERRIEDFGPDFKPKPCVMM